MQKHPAGAPCPEPDPPSFPCPCFLSSVSPPPLPPLEESVPRPRSLTSFGHLSGANRFIQENRSNQVPEGASPRVRALPGHPPRREPCAHARTHTERLGDEGWGGERAFSHRPQTQTTSLQPFAILVSRGLPVHSGSAEPLQGRMAALQGRRGAGTARRARKNTAPYVPDQRRTKRDSLMSRWD